MTPFEKYKNRIKKRKEYKALRFIVCKQAYVFCRERIPTQGLLDFMMFKALKRSLRKFDAYRTH